MSPREANVLLTQAALLDVRLRRDPAERADMATAWAMVLADVPLDRALDAVNEHYQNETRAVMPADIVTLAGDPVRSASDAGNITEQRLARATLAPGSAHE
jgi:hypothetical protein